jgi:hypothetical protein
LSDARLLCMLLQALPALKAQPSPAALNQLAARLKQSEAYASLSSHSLCELVWAFGALWAGVAGGVGNTRASAGPRNYPELGSLLRGMAGVLEERVVVQRVELLTLPSALKLAWGWAVLCGGSGGGRRLRASRLVTHALIRALGAPPDAFLHRPQYLRMVLELKSMLELEARSGGYWRALSRRWEAQVRAYVCCMFVACTTVLNMF